MMRKAGDYLKMKKNKKIELLEEHILMNDNTPFAVRESFGHLRTNILYTARSGEDAPVLCVTSAGESSGKSTVIANLAYSFASMGKKIVLIDGDMRCPVQQNFFGYKKDSTGLSEFLSGIAKTKEEVILKTDTEGLDVIPSGHIPPNPSELIANQRFAKLLEELKRSYDYVFIDFPPVNIVADPISVVKLISGYIFVVRSKVSDSVSAGKAIESIETVGGSIIGIVFKDVNFKDGMGGRYGKGKYSHYSKYNRYEDAANSASKK